MAETDLLVHGELETLPARCKATAEEFRKRYQSWAGLVARMRNLAAPHTGSGSAIATWQGVTKQSPDARLERWA